MTCVELQQSLAEIEDGSTAEQQAHLRTCPSCSVLVEELALIVGSAPALLETEVPSPRVWNSIEMQLRREGLIRPQPAKPAPSLSLAAAASSSRWGWARWAVPAVALLILVGIYVKQHSPISSEVAVESQSPITSPVKLAGLNAGLNDDELLQEISSRTPAMKEQYVDNLRQVNNYIADAQRIVDADPYDQEARRSLMEAYQQKSMLFELAVDRSLP
jgi:hypothetical protein